MDLMWLDQPAWVDGRPLLRRVRQRYYRLGMLTAMKRANRILTISKATANRVMAVVPEARGRIVVAHCAVSADFRVPTDFDAAADRAAKLTGFEGHYFLVVGKNEP